MTDIIVGASVDLSLPLLRSVNGVLTPTDPETLTVTVVAPDGTFTSYAWAAAEPDPAFTHTGTGTFLLSWTVDQAGRWRWRAVTDDGLVGEGALWVLASLVP